MPAIEVLFYQDKDGTIPPLEWFAGLPAKVLEKCLARLVRLEELGHELRRPEGDCGITSMSCGRVSRG